jgi:predicted permease
VNRSIAQVIRKLGNLVSAKRADAEFDREVGTHLAFLEEEFLHRGLTPAEARRKARLACGGLELTRQIHRDGRSFLWLAQAGQDLRHALGSMGRSKGFTAAAVLTLALGVGANTAVFSVIDAVLLKPLDYPEPSRIVQFFLSSPAGTARGESIPDLRFLLDGASSVEQISAYDFSQSEMGLTSAVPEQVHGIHVTSNFFRLFGVPFLEGRGFNEDEDKAQGANVVVLSYRLWKRRFGGDEGIIGKQISLNKSWFTVVGVTAEGFAPESGAELWIPFHFNLNAADGVHSFAVAARLRPGVTLAQANAQLRAVSDPARRAGKLPDPDFDFQLRGLKDAMVSDGRSSLVLLQGAVILVFLIACANLGNLLMIRMTVRRREFAIRGAIGAGRGRILRQLTVESLLLNAIGCFIGAAMGLFGVRALLKAGPDALPFHVALGLDWRVLGFAAGVSLLTSLVFGLLPAVKVCREGFESLLRESGNRPGTGARTNRAHSLVVVSEVALSLILLVGAALLMRTFIALDRVDPGFDRSHVVLMTMPLGGDRPATASGLAEMVREARVELEAVPGVSSCAATFSAPYASRMGLPFLSASNASTISGDAEWMAVSPGYFRTLRIPVLRGRDLNSNDTPDAPAVVVINEALAKRYWAGRDPLGQQIVIGMGLGAKVDDKPRQIIGIVGDARDEDLSHPAEPTMIIPDAQQSDQMVAFWAGFGPLHWLIRSPLETGHVVSAASPILERASGGRPVGSIQTLEDVLSASLARERFNMLLLSLFALIALLLAATGIYGVMAYSVSRRAQEMGLRMALGADRRSVQKMVLSQALGQGLVGVACGMCAAFFLVRLLSGELYGVSMRDPAVFLGVAAFLVLLTAGSAWIPARRASRLDPAQALRME